MHECEISEEESCSEHNFLKYKIGKANSHKYKYNYQGIKYVVKKENYYEFDRKFEDTQKIFKNIIYKRRVEEVDMNLSTTVAKENDLEWLVDSFTEAMQTHAGKLLK